MRNQAISLTEDQALGNNRVENQTMLKPDNSPLNKVVNLKS
jgi:hypothetical protein